MSFFGRLFDFNRDGETDFSEELLGLGMIAAVAGAAEEEEQLQRGTGGRRGRRDGAGYSRLSRRDE